MRFRPWLLAFLCLFGSACTTQADTATREKRLLLAAKNGDTSVMTRLLDEIGRAHV